MTQNQQNQQNNAALIIMILDYDMRGKTQLGHENGQVKDMTKPYEQVLNNSMQNAQPAQEKSQAPDMEKLKQAAQIFMALRQQMADKKSDASNAQPAHETEQNAAAQMQKQIQMLKLMQMLQQQRQHAA